MGKRVIIPWSGGLDSTYLVYSNLRDGNIVKPVYITIRNNAEKVKREKEVITKLTELFRGMDLSGELYDLSHGSEFETHGNQNLSFAQMPIWIIGLLFTDWYSCDEIQMGYVMNDDAVSYLDDIQKIWKSYSGIANGSMLPLKFPLRKMKKRDVWNDLPKEIRQLTVFCEPSHNGVDCGECDSCKRYKYEDLYYMYERNAKVEKASPQLSFDFDCLSPSNEEIEVYDKVESL